MYTKFYKKDIAARKAVLAQDQRYDESLDTPLPESVYDNMIENAITTYELPMGVAPGFLINGKDVVMAMVTEEPSVIAAASNAAKIFQRNGGITSYVESRFMRGQIAFANPVNPQEMMDYVENNFSTLQDIAHTAYPSIVKRGGGLHKIETKYVMNPDKTHFLIVYLIVDTQEAMGANMMNTMLEAVKSYLAETFATEALMGILSNLTTESVVHASVRLNPDTLKHSDLIASRIKQASDLAMVDPYRAATHNKGIMNGIDAVVLASGNDWRAIEAAVHSYASLSGTYQPLTKWSIADNGDILGSITLPMPIGAVGGSMGIHPKAQLARKIMKFENAQDLMMMIASVGLAQNFAAIYALTTDGIQKGHMALHARSLALQAGALAEHLDAIVTELTQTQPMNLEAAHKIVSKYEGRE